MMKTINRYNCLLLFVFLFTNSVFATNITEEKARLVAGNFIELNSRSFGFGEGDDVTLTRIPYTSAAGHIEKETEETENTYFYVFNVNHKGYIIISGYDNVKPVLGYSTDHNFNIESLHPSLIKFLDGYRKEMDKTLDDEVVDDGVAQEWTNLIHGSVPRLKSTMALVEPLIESNWGQSEFYNEMCPYDEAIADHALTGSVAAAMAQVMNYYEYPSVGKGYHSYSHPLYGTQFANFSKTTYDWASMPNDVLSSNDAVAGLMYHCGISVDMNYNVDSEGGSGAYLISDRSPVQNSAEYALKTYFNYSNSLDGITRNNYQGDWISAIKDELDNGRPVLYAAWGPNGQAGDVFIVDGYDENDLFHINWGNGGTYNGFYTLDELNPGSHDYTSNHQAIIGIEPSTTKLLSYQLELNQAVNYNSSINYGDPFNVSANIVNNGSVNFDGDFSAVLIDEDMGVVSSKLNSFQYLGAGQSKTVYFSFSGDDDLFPGNYTLSILYKPYTDQWMYVEDGAFNNSNLLQVNWTSDIELFDSIVLNTGLTIEQEQAFDITTDFYNNSASDFTGDFSFVLYNQDGTLMSVIAEKDSLTLCAGCDFAENPVFSSTGLNVPVGTYFLAAHFTPEGGNRQLTGSSFYSNPIKINVREKALDPDIYEINNSTGSAKTLVLSFTEDIATVNTEGANIHVGNDVDYYKIVFEDGYDYVINGRVHDAYNSGNGNTYSADVSWSYQKDGTWSAAFDDVLVSGIEVSGSNVLHFAVAPYLPGNLGSYLLEFTVNRSETENISIISPNNTSAWELGSSHNIQWSDNIDENVDIVLYKGANLVDTIASSVESNGSFDWQIPESYDEGTDYQIKISSTIHDQVFDNSDFFSILLPGFISIEIPNDTINWLVNTTQTISWTDNIEEEVKIDLLRAGNFIKTISLSTPNDGSFEWTISQDLQEAPDYRVKITSVDDNSITDTSDLFTIYKPPYIDIVAPLSTSNWEINQQHDIEWADNIDENVKIELYKSDVVVEVITGSTLSNGLFTWEMPGNYVEGSDYQIKITSLVDDTIFDISDQFTLYETEYISITSPIKSTDWNLGTTRVIKWNDNISENVKIELFQSGEIKDTISLSTASNGIFNWNIDTALKADTGYTVRITSILTDTISDESPSFKLSEIGEVNITSPNQSSEWAINSIKTIQWTDNMADNVKIQLLRGGVFIRDIISSTESDGVFEWILPLTLEEGTEYQVKISSIIDTLINDVSEQFTILPPQEILVISPDNSSDWKLGKSHTIQWNDNFDEDVAIELYKADTLYEQIIDLTLSDGSFIWNIAESYPEGSDYQVKITNSADNSIYDISEYFTLSEPGLITFTYPNNTTRWEYGSVHEIQWSDNIEENVRIDLYKGGILLESLVASTPSDGSYEWSIAESYEIGSDYQIKITSVNDEGVFVFSDQFSITEPGLISINIPNNGTSWEIGTVNTIQWSDNITDNVKIELYKAGIKIETITSSTLSDGSFDWDIPSGYPEGTDYQIKISSTVDDQVYVISDQFSLFLAAYITIASPYISANWYVGQIYNVKWSDNINDEVKVELLKNNEFFMLITDSFENTGTYSWSVDSTLVPDTDYQIKVSSVEDAGISDVSDYFNILNEDYLKVLSPDKNTDWKKGSIQTITWSDIIDENVKIELYYSGSLSRVLAASVESNGAYSWEIQSELIESNKYQVKVSSISNEAIYDLSESFRISGPSLVKVLSPVDTTIFYSGTVQEILWTDKLTENVIISLYKNNNFDRIITWNTLSDSSFNWVIPSGMPDGDDYQIRIASVLDNSIDDISPMFTISSQEIISMISPVDTTVLETGDMTMIEWSSTIEDSVMIELYNDGSFIQTLSSSYPNTGSFNWEVPLDMVESPDYQVKVISKGNSSYFDISPHFRIKKPDYIHIISPDNSSAWLPGEVHPITWNDNFDDNVVITLYKSGIEIDTIAKSIESTGSFSWLISETFEPANDYMVKLFHVSRPDVADSSELFTLLEQPTITIQYPADTSVWNTGMSHLITWNDNIESNINIELYKNDLYIERIALNQANSGEFEWNIPESHSGGDNYQIKVVSVDDQNIFDFSDYFTIRFVDNIQNTEKLENNVLIYPNPTRDILNLKLEKGGYYEIIIIDATGRAVYTGTTEKQEKLHEISVSHLKAGFYVLKLSGENHHYKTINIIPE